MKKVSCVFCGKESEKAKEHIWPRWLQIETTGSTTELYRGSHFITFNPVDISRRVQYGETLVFGSVCSSCNTGWMSSLENECKPVIKELIADTNKIIHLNKSERQVLALWAFKTALMINAGSNYRKIIPDDHYNHIYKHRTLPEDLKVDVCHIKKYKELAWRQSQVSFGVVPKEKQAEFIELAKDSYRITMQIKSFGIRLIYFPTAKEKGYAIKIDDYQKCYRIWPYQENRFFNCEETYTNMDEFDLDNVIIAST
jgi:hypothetical protein